MSSKSISEIRRYLRVLQEDVCLQLMEEDGGGCFVEDVWQRAEGGGGVTRVLRSDKIIEHAGVNFSEIQGANLPPAASLMRKELTNCAFKALGVSIVIHPRNPYVPTTHANVRFFVAEKEGQEPIWWFGGGFDLTPYYPFEEDCIDWHRNALHVCQPFGETVYPRFKKNCDEYFYLKHRNECRGIGGLFFDDLNEWPFEGCFKFVRAVGDQFIKSYRSILSKRKHHVFGEKERAFQLYRRGRYVEFNLLYDRGTLFGLQSGGRTESILMSLPPKVHWEYNYVPEPESKESKLKEFLKPRDWID